MASQRNYDKNAGAALWSILRNRNFKGLRFRRSYEFDNHFSDFFCHEKRISIELYPSKEIHSNGLLRFEQLAGVGKMDIKVIRLTDKEVLDNPELISEELMHHLQ